MKCKPKFSKEKHDTIYRFQSKILKVYRKNKIQTLCNKNHKCKTQDILRNIISLK